MQCLFCNAYTEGSIAGQDEERQGARGKDWWEKGEYVGAEYRLGQAGLNMGAQAIRVPGSTLVLGSASCVPAFHQGPLLGCQLSRYNQPTSLL